MATGTQRQIEALAKDVANFREELTRLAESHNLLVAAMNRMAGVVGRLGNDITASFNQQHIAMQAIIATTSEVLDTRNVIPLADWQATLEFNYERRAAAAKQEIEAATMKDTEELFSAAPDPAASSLILP